MERIQSKPFFAGKDETVYDAGEGTTRQFVGYDNDIMMVKMTFEKGAVGYLHSHPHSQVSYIISGKYEVKVGGETRILVTGDGFYAEPDINHGLVCLEAGEIIDVFTPIREDFYQKISHKE